MCTLYGVPNQKKIVQICTAPYYTLIRKKKISFRCKLKYTDDLLYVCFVYYLYRKIAEQKIIIIMVIMKTKKKRNESELS